MQCIFKDVVKGVNSRVTIKELAEKVKTVEVERDTWKKRYEQLTERIRPFLEAVKHAPKRVLAFLKSIMREPPEVNKPQQTVQQHTTPERKRSYGMDI